MDDLDASTDAGDAGTPVVEAGPIDAASDGEPPSECASLLKQIDTGREALTRCCVACNSIQCNAMVDDVCCSAAYTNQGANPDVAKKFAALVAEYKSKCKFACPPVLCPANPSMTCDPSSAHCRGN